MDQILECKVNCLTTNFFSSFFSCYSLYFSSPIALFLLLSFIPLHHSFSSYVVLFYLFSELISTDLFTLLLFFPISFHFTCLFISFHFHLIISSCCSTVFVFISSFASVHSLFVFSRFSDSFILIIIVSVECHKIVLQASQRAGR